MIAVTDTGPLLVLAKLHHLHLLPELYSTIQVPSSVYHEAVVVGLARGYIQTQLRCNHSCRTAVGRPTQTLSWTPGSWMFTWALEKCRPFHWLPNSMLNFSLTTTERVCKHRR